MQHPPVKMTLSRTLAVWHLSGLMGRQRRLHPLDVVLLAKVAQTTEKGSVGEVWKANGKDSNP